MHGNAWECMGLHFWKIRKKTSYDKLASFTASPILFLSPTLLLLFQNLHITGGHVLPFSMPPVLFLLSVPLPVCPFSFAEQLLVA